MSVVHRLATPLILAFLCFGCAQETGNLSADQESRLAAQGITHRANNLMFRHTRGAGGRWDNVRASIVVTQGTILIHRNGEVDFLYEPRSRRACEVHRDHERIRISAGSRQSAEAWSFEPPDDPQAWAVDMRHAIASSKAR